MDRRKRQARGAIRFLGGLLTLSALLLGVVLGGRQYFYCHMMNVVMSPADCGCAAHLDPDAQAAVRATDDCFELRTLDRLHAFTVSSEWAVPPASLVATLPAPIPAFDRVGTLAAGLDHPIRAGPASPGAARTRLMVFLI